MSSFSKTLTPVKSLGEIHSYVGMPNCDAFYAWVHESLEELMHSGFEPPNPPVTEITTGQMGNLGETITWLVGHAERFGKPPYVAALGSALTPFNSSAAIGVDITIVYLDPNGNASNDRLFIQEVKTTGQQTLAYSAALIGDYEKLLDSNKPSLSLMSRVSALKCKLKWEHHFPSHLLRRVEDLARPIPADCTRICLLPTLVHDKALNPVNALTDVMFEIKKQGWPSGCIEAWSISISSLNQALINMANRRNITP